MMNKFRNNVSSESNLRDFSQPKMLITLTRPWIPSGPVKRNDGIYARVNPI
jgi:hypothetical protein